MLGEIICTVCFITTVALFGVVFVKLTRIERKMNKNRIQLEDLINKSFEEMKEEFSALNEDISNRDLKITIDKGFLELSGKIKPSVEEKTENDQYFKNEDGLYSYKAMQENKRLGQDPTARRK